MKYKVLKEGLTQRRPDGSFIDVPVGHIGEFSPETVQWLMPRGFFELVKPKIKKEVPEND